MALITIPLKTIDSSLTSNEFNQLLEALKLGTRSIKTLDLEASNMLLTGDATFQGTVDINGVTGPFSKYFELSHVIYVGSGGGVYDGVNWDGSSPGKALGSFQNAIDNVELIFGETPTRDHTICIVCLDGDTYEEDIVCKDYVDIHAPNAILRLGGVEERQLNIKGNRVLFNKITRDTGTNDMIISSATAGDSMLFAHAVIDSGTGVTVHNIASTSLYVSVERFEVLGANGIGISDYGPGNHHGHYHINSLLVGATGAIAIQNTGPGYSIGYVDAISYEFLPVTGTKAFDVQDGRLSFNCNYIETHTAYELAGDAILELISSRIIGSTITSTGTALTFQPSDISEIDNTSDLNKPISTATQNALDLKAPLVHTHPYEPANANIQTHIADTSTNPHMVDKADVGLSEVDNTSDLNKPISTATQNALDLKSDSGHTHTTLATVALGDLGGGNYTAFEADGSQQLYGTATVWEDIAGPILGSTLGSSIGTAEYNWDNNSVTFAPSGNITLPRDRVAFVIQRPHKAKLDSSFRLHAHWEQIDATSRTFTFRYRIQELGGIKNNAWTTISVNTNDANRFAYSTGTLNQITELAEIDMSLYGISTQIQVQLTRSDAIAGDIEVSFIDFHYEIDTLGSRQEYAK